jgi:hypothetical protein
MLIWLPSCTSIWKKVLLLLLPLYAAAYFSLLLKRTFHLAAGPLGRTISSIHIISMTTATTTRGPLAYFGYILLAGEKCLKKVSQLLLLPWFGL